MRRIILILSLLFCSQLITASNLLIEAESFDQKGRMGSRPAIHGPYGVTLSNGSWNGGPG